MFCPSKDQLGSLANLHCDRLGQLKNNRKHLDELTTFLIASPLVKNFYIFFDAIEIWLSEKPNELSKRPIIDFDGYVKSLENMVVKKGWQFLAQEYVSASTDRYYMNGLTGKILSSHNLTTNENYIRVTSNLDYTPDELFGRNHDIKFKYESRCGNSLCIDTGDCGFILCGTSGQYISGYLFLFHLLINPKLYPDDMHLHINSVQAENLHLALDITNSAGRTMLNVPVTWHGLPSRDKISKYWRWGHHCFYEKGEGLQSGYTPFSYHKHHGSSCKIRPVVFVIRN